MLLYCIHVWSACFQSMQQLARLAFSFISAVFHRNARVPLIRRSVGSWEPVFPRAAAAPRWLHDNTLSAFWHHFRRGLNITIIKCGHYVYISWHPSHIHSLLQLCLDILNCVFPPQLLLFSNLISKLCPKIFWMVIWLDMLSTGCMTEKPDDDSWQWDAGCLFEIYSLFLKHFLGFLSDILRKSISWLNIPSYFFAQWQLSQTWQYQRSVWSQKVGKHLKMWHLPQLFIWEILSLDKTSLR